MPSPRRWASSARSWPPGLNVDSLGLAKRVHVASDASDAARDADRPCRKTVPRTSSSQRDLFATLVRDA